MRFPGLPGRRHLALRRMQAACASPQCLDVLLAAPLRPSMAGQPRPLRCSVNAPQSFQAEWKSLGAGSPVRRSIQAVKARSASSMTRD
jgi:hypothetical protein